MYEPNTPSKQTKSPGRLPVDSKSNLINVCLFESYLAKCVLENQTIFQNSFLTMISGIQYFFESKSPKLDQLLQTKPKRFNLDRELFSIFTCLRIEYPGYDSFQSLKERPFNLSACCYFIKLLADKILKPDYSPSSSPSFFPNGQEKRSPYSPLRPSLLFDNENRGVIDLETDVVPTTSIGIVESAHQPDDLKSYFQREIYPSMSLYVPKEDSYVALWLRKRNLPVISGSSGSTELLFSRIFPLIEISPEEMKMIIFAQALDMVAQGHHSFFETILVAEFFNLGHFPMEKTDLLTFYMHWVPPFILRMPWFNQFLQENLSVRAVQNYNVSPEETSVERSDRNQSITTLEHSFVAPGDSSSSFRQ